MESLGDIGGRLAAAARSRSPETRAGLLFAVVDLAEQTDTRDRPQVRALFRDLLMALVVEAERDIRLRLSERLANAGWAPSALVNVLALDDIEIARPVIARSPVLQDADLVRLLVEATLEHRIEVARRPGLGAEPVAAILDRGEPDVLTALAGNETAQVDGQAMERLVAASRRYAAVRAPLARHPRLTGELALALYGWIGETLRGQVAARFDLDAALLSTAMNGAVSDAHLGRTAGGRPRAAPADEQAEMESRLVAKLDAAGQLRPGYLLRALREGKLSLFRTALASLGGYAAGGVTAATNGARPEALALACAGVGIDRSVFPTVLALVRGLNDGRPGETPESIVAVQAAFRHPDARAAAQAFRTFSATV